VIPKISLYVRTNRKGKRTYTLANTRKQAPEGVYCLRYEVNGRRIWESVGTSLSGGMPALKTRELAFAKGEILEAAQRKAANPAHPKPALAEQRDLFLSKKKRRNGNGGFLNSWTISAYVRRDSRTPGVSKFNWRRDSEVWLGLAETSCSQSQ
jgi:hypothetical protein